MRRKSSLILLVAAVFCVALAPLLREFVFPRMVAGALSGEDAYRVVVLDATDATLLGAPEGPGKARITAIQTIRPDAKASKDGTVVWDLNLAVLDSTGKVVTQLPERYAFEAAGQIPRNCCGESIDGAPAAHTGLAYKWPFFTGKRDYNYYDSQAHSANVIAYKGTAKRDGLQTYRFEQEVPWMKVPMPKQLPGGLDPIAVEKQGMQLWYTATRRMWVEPVTGIPVYLEETRTEELRTSPPADDPNARPVVTKVFEGTFKPRPAWSQKLIADAKDESKKLRAVHDTIPLALLVTGVVLFLIAVALQFIADRNSRPTPPPATTPETVDTPDTPRRVSAPDPAHPR
ncbi:DUF3068 domain-containing protein [Embleya sp. NBC_00888]|uniref:DUF3068 domain-containing protein n=1 Tax=Embleya sp. NBC_00888 TaxID=2975960 RepID=UPI00386B9CAC|nr:DUF3068 domain-containing protein [Embleya sp. NBC_00888]